MPFVISLYKLKSLPLYKTFVLQKKNKNFNMPFNFRKKMIEKTHIILFKLKKSV